MRKRKKSRDLPVGSVSHGTMKTDDLIEAFTSALDDILLTREERLLVNRIQREMDSKFEVPSEEQDNMLDELFIIMEDHAPPYTRFGSHEGDGSDYGVWIDWSHIEEAEREKQMGRGPSLPPAIRDGGPADFLVVNDHGNCTMYHFSGNRWTEVWSVV